MNISEIREKWMILPVNGRQQIRVSKDCLPELFLGVDEDGKRSLILWLKANTIIDYQNCYKEKISIEYFSQKKAIQLKLNDNNFFDLFDDLILSIINHIQDVLENVKYPKVMFTTFHKWSNFFEERRNDILQPTIIQGIWGEMFVLHQLLCQANSCLLYNDILSSWKGPYRKGHDFETDIIDIEVKTKEVTRPSVKISSEYQLDEQNNKPLELLVLSVRSNTQAGRSLNDLFMDIKTMLQKGNGDLTILLRALIEVRIDSRNIKKYEEYRYTAIEEVTYDCSNKGFPRYTPAILKQGVFNVQYELKLLDIINFVKVKKKFEEVSV